MKEPIWIGKSFTLAIHEEMLAGFGGSAGVRDVGLLESALGKPRNLFAYGKPTLVDLAASYAFGVVRNHPFIDGNKRTGFMVAYTFLARNGIEFTASEADAAAAVLAIAAGQMKEAELSSWLAANTRKTNAIES